MHLNTFHKQTDCFELRTCAITTANLSQNPTETNSTRATRPPTPHAARSPSHMCVQRQVRDRGGEREKGGMGGGGRFDSVYFNTEAKLEVQRYSFSQ